MFDCLARATLIRTFLNCIFLSTGFRGFRQALKPIWVAVSKCFGFDERIRVEERPIREKRTYVVSKISLVFYG